MVVCGLSNARPISCNDCPTFHRFHISVFCAGESFDRFLRIINTILKKRSFRWCCIDLLNPPPLMSLLFPVEISPQYDPPKGVEAGEGGPLCSRDANETQVGCPRKITLA